MLRPRLVYLGGLVLAVGVAFVAILVAGQAASGHGFFTLSTVRLVAGHPIMDDTRSGADAGVLPALSPLVVAAYPLPQPAAPRVHHFPGPVLAPWGIRFAAPWAVTNWMWPIRKNAEPLLPEYKAAPGPRHLVCCAAARSNTRPPA